MRGKTKMNNDFSDFRLAMLDKMMGLAEFLIESSSEGTSADDHKYYIEATLDEFLEEIAEWEEEQGVEDGLKVLGDMV